MSNLGDRCFAAHNWDEHQIVAKDLHVVYALTSGPYNFHVKFETRISNLQNQVSGQVI